MSKTYLTVLYKRVLRGHVVRLMARGRSRKEALSDACFLVALPTAANVGSVVLLAGIPLPDNRAFVLAAWMLLWALSEILHRRLVNVWASELDRPVQAEAGQIGDNALSWIYTLGSIFAGFLVAAVTGLR